MIRVAHEQADAVSGSTSAIEISGDKVTLDLAPFISAAKQQLVETASPPRIGCPACTRPSPTPRAW